MSNVYDNRNRLIAANDGSGFYTRYEYDNMANVTRMATGVSTLTEALDRDVHSVTDYEYSYRDFLTTVTDPMGYTESYTYNSRGTKLTYTDKNGTLFEYTYNGAPWLLSETATGTDNTTQTISYTYDYLGNIAQMVDESGTVVYTYDGLGNVLTETKGTLVKEYSYDLNGNRTSADITQGTFSHLMEYTYDNNNRLSRVTDDNGYTQYVYDKNNRLTSEKSYNGSTLSKLITQSEYTYYPGGLLKSKENAVGTGLSQSTTANDSYTLTYYADGNIATVNNNNSVTTYVYDSANRLLSESIDGVLKASYTYDARGNRLTKTEPDRVTTYAVRKDNQIGNAITEGEGIYEYHYYDYDNNGNLKEDYSYDTTLNYKYNLFGNLVRAYTTNNVTIATYTYDGNGIRTSKTVGGVTTNFIIDGGYVVGEISGDSVIKYTYGNSLVNINNNGTLGYYQTDEHGNVSAIVNTSRSIVADYDFDAFGNETISTENYYNPMRYCGEYYDEETGLIYLRARYYDPSIGRFISEDPIKDGTNWYVYCSNNPVAFVDPSGQNAAVAQNIWDWTITTSGQLTQVDGPYPFGDIVAGGVVIVGGIATGVALLYDIANADGSNISQQNDDEPPEEEPGEVPEEIPDVKFPGNDPTKPPGEGWEWRGNGDAGSKEGNWYNPSTDETWHPDLDHAEPIGPHWDYKHPSGKWYRVFPNGDVARK